MTMITPSYLGETIEYSSLHACRSTLEDPTLVRHGDDVTVQAEREHDLGARRNKRNDAHDGDQSTPKRPFARPQRT